MQFGEKIRDLFLLYRFKNLNDAFLVVGGVNPLKNLAVFASTHLSHHLIIILLPDATNQSPELSNQTQKKKVEINK